MMKTAIKHKSRRFRRFLKGTEAVSALEYALLVGIVALGVVGVLTAFGDAIIDHIQTVTTNIGNANNAQATGSGP